MSNHKGNAMKSREKFLSVFVMCMLLLGTLAGCRTEPVPNGENRDTDAPAISDRIETTDTDTSGSTTEPIETTDTAETTATDAEPEPRVFDQAKQDEIIRSIQAYNDGERQKEKIGYKAVSVKATLLFTNWIHQPGYTNAQGGFFDGDYYYTAFTRRVDGEETAVIGVFDRDGNYVKESQDLPIHHANAISDMGDGTLLVTDHDPNGGRDYTILDKETLTVIKKDFFGFPMLSMDYCIETGLYAVCGTGHGEYCRILDSEKNVLLTRKIDFKSGTDPQNFCCTPNDLFAPRYTYHSASNTMQNYIYRYSWTLGLKEVYSIEIDPGIELEALSVVNGKMYAISSDHTNRTMAVFLLEFPEGNV